ncbi:MAG: hypothetical protein NUV78_00100 [Candidatus Zambryskibacteria bacterium]|nr:hypothetical protein [Candidatus Zambryskibacteria bacterium]
MKSTEFVDFDEEKSSSPPREAKRSKALLARSRAGNHGTPVLSRLAGLDNRISRTQLKAD